MLWHNINFCCKDLQCQFQLIQYTTYILSECGGTTDLLGHLPLNDANCQTHKGGTPFTRSMYIYACVLRVRMHFFYFKNKLKYLIFSILKFLKFHFVFIYF